MKQGEHKWEVTGVKESYFCTQKTDLSSEIKRLEDMMNKISAVLFWISYIEVETDMVCLEGYPQPWSWKTALHMIPDSCVRSLWSEINAKLELSHLYTWI